ncbi:hypothetical protein B296_00058990 [Ensete ventricosum]|uniref:Uncharacterized protein n=1 Tax=Ensete ventricosum TaxID=4639 RepID=A0A426X3M3_ENSVE|nr:hypothetical protein B296_00058990 [Ensete ventricosum]
MRLGTRQECVGNLPRVSGVCHDGAREFARRRPRLVGRLSGVAEKLVWSYDGLVTDIRRRDREARWEHAGRLLEEDQKTRCKNIGGRQISGIRYSPRGEEAPSGVPTGKKGHRERLTMVETRLDVLEASVEELYQGQGRLLAVESSQEEAESQIEKVESLIDQLT